MPVTATRRFVLGTVLAAAGAARAGIALQPAPALPYAGGVVRGGGAATTVLDVTDEAFGAVGDGVLLGDLVTTAGSAGITSATAPFRSTEADRGKLVVWRGADDTVGTGRIASVQSSSSATLEGPASVASRSDGGPNTNAVFGTDNTDALDKALASAQAGAAAVAPERAESVPAVRVHVPRGVFLTRALKPATQAGITVTGEGRYSSLIASAAEGAWFQLGEYEASPSDAFQGTASGWTFQDLHFINPVFRNGSSEGKRTGTAIQDNGSGRTKVLGCGFTGLSYGFCAAYGSDFSQLRDCVFYLCDTGYYFGPGSQQLDVDKTDAALCRECAVFEGAPQWHIGGGSSFEDPTIAAITIEGKASGTTRLGVPVALGGAYYSGSFVVDGGTWFETNSGTNGRFAPRMVLMSGDGPFEVPAEGLVVRDAYLVAGGDQQAGGTNCFVEYASARVSEEPVLIEGLVVAGGFVNSVFRASGAATDSRPRLVSITRPDGVALLQGPTSGAKVLERDGSLRWAARLSAPDADSPALTLRAQGGDTPLLAVAVPEVDGPVSGFAANGAVLEAHVGARSAGGGVRIDATRCNYFSCRISGTVGLTIENPPTSTSQRLTVELVAVGGARTVSWPTDCRFAGGAAPTAVAAGTRTSVTFLRDPAGGVWVETARAIGVPA